MNSQKSQSNGSNLDCSGFDHSKPEGQPIKNDLRHYYHKDYYHSTERFCNKNKNLYLHCIQRKPRFVENNELSYEPNITPDGGSEPDVTFYSSFYSNFTNNCSNILSNWYENCKHFISNSN